MHPFKLYRLRDGRPVKVLGESDVADKLRLMNAAPALLAALKDLREAASDAYKSGRISAEPFVRAGNVISEAEGK